MPTEERIEEFTASLKKYVNTNYELIKLEAAERSALIGSSMISGFVIGMTGILLVFFLSLAASSYFSACLGDNYSGFVIVASFYFLLLLVLLAGRKTLMQKCMRDRIIQEIFSRN